MARILHLSDTHVSADGPDEDGVDAVASLRAILHDCRHVPDLDLVVVSGDVADDGSLAGYRVVRELVGGFATARGIPHVYCTGNHDDRAGFQASLGSGHLASDGSDIGVLLDPGRDTRAAVSQVAGLRIVTLDSLVPGRAPGLLGPPQLAWLRSVLGTPSPGGSVLVLHHPPLRLDSWPFVAGIGLQDAAALAEVIAGSDVRAILTGHLHFQLSGSLAGVPVWVTPGVVTRIDLTGRPGTVRGVLGASATVVDLADAADATFHLLHARDPRAGDQVYLYNPVTGEDVGETD